MTWKDLLFVSILHQKLRSLDHCLLLLYHLVSGQTHTWSKSNANVKQAIALAKKETIEHLNNATQMSLDTPTNSGGNTNTGPLAERFFRLVKYQRFEKLFR